MADDDELERDVLDVAGYDEGARKRQRLDDEGECINSKRCRQNCRGWQRLSLGLDALRRLASALQEIVQHRSVHGRNPLFVVRVTGNSRPLSPIFAFVCVYKSLKDLKRYPSCQTF